MDSLWSPVDSPLAQCGLVLILGSMLELFYVGSTEYRIRLISDTGATAFFLEFSSSSFLCWGRGHATKE